MTARTRLLAGAGALALAVAALLALAPGLLPVPESALRPAVAALTGTVGLGGLAALAGVLAVVQGLRSSTTATPPPMDAAGESSDDGAAGPVAGADFDQRLAATRRVGDRTTQSEAVVREDLRRLATDVYRSVHRCDWETAARAVEAGDWTDDAAAAAFVGGPEAPDTPLRVWLRAVLSDEGAFYVQTTRTIRAIYDLQAAGDPAATAGATPDGVSDR